MKAVILAAGKGTRMKELALHTPKPIIKVGERPFLYYIIKALHEVGIKDIGIVVGYKKEKIEEFVKSHGLNVALIEQKEQLGTGNAVKTAQDFVGDDNFIVVNGDNLYAIEDIKSIAKEDEYCYISATKSERPERYGVLIFDEQDHLQKIIEKPKEFVGDMINAGLYKFTKDVFNALDKIELSERGEYELTDAITVLTQQKKIKIMEMKKDWADLTSPEDIPKVEAYIKEHLIEFCE